MIKKENLDIVFLPRKKVGVYHKIDSESIKLLEEIFMKTPYPPKSELISLATQIQQTEIKIRNWFKSQRKKDFVKNKKIIKNYKQNHSFNPKQREILEQAFRTNQNLTLEVLQQLQEKLDVSQNLIKQWYYYRHRKLKKSISQLNCKNTQQIEIKHKQESKSIENISQNRSRNSTEISSNSPCTNNFIGKHQDKCCSEHDRDSSNQKSEEVGNNISNSNSNSENNINQSSKSDSKIEQNFMPEYNNYSNFQPQSPNLQNQILNSGNQNHVIQGNIIQNQNFANGYMNSNNFNQRRTYQQMSGMPMQNPMQMQNSNFITMGNNCGMNNLNNMNNTQQNYACMPNGMQANNQASNSSFLVRNGNNFFLMMPVSFNGNSNTGAGLQNSVEKK